MSLFFCSSSAYLGRHTSLSSGCIIGAMCHVTSHEMLPENTVIYGEKCDRRVQAERPAVWITVDSILRNIICFMNRLRKTFY